MHRKGMHSYSPFTSLLPHKHKNTSFPPHRQRTNISLLPYGREKRKKKLLFFFLCLFFFYWKSNTQSYCHTGIKQYKLAPFFFFNQTHKLVHAPPQPQAGRLTGVHELSTSLSPHRLNTNTQADSQTGSKTTNLPLHRRNTKTTSLPPHRQQN